jgi:hypothetical protein
MTVDFMCFSQLGVLVALAPATVSTTDDRTQITTISCFGSLSQVLSGTVNVAAWDR